MLNPIGCCKIHLQTIPDLHYALSERKRHKLTNPLMSRTPRTPRMILVALLGGMCCLPMFPQAPPPPAQPAPAAPAPIQLPELYAVKFQNISLRYSLLQTSMEKLQDESRQLVIQACAAVNIPIAECELDVQAGTIKRKALAPPSPPSPPKSESQPPTPTPTPPPTPAPAKSAPAKK